MSLVAVFWGFRVLTMMPGTLVPCTVNQGFQVKGMNKAEETIPLVELRWMLIVEPNTLDNVQDLKC